MAVKLWVRSEASLTQAACLGFTLKYLDILVSDPVLTSLHMSLSLHCVFVKFGVLKDAVDGELNGSI